MFIFIIFVQKKIYLFIKIKYIKKKKISKNKQKKKKWAPVVAPQQY
jgi:hypothetical protein